MKEERSTRSHVPADSAALTQSESEAHQSLQPDRVVSSPPAARAEATAFIASSSAAPPIAAAAAPALFAPPASPLRGRSNNASVSHTSIVDAPPIAGLSFAAANHLSSTIVPADRSNSGEPGVSLLAPSVAAAAAAAAANIKAATIALAADSQSSIDFPVHTAAPTVVPLAATALTATSLSAARSIDSSGPLVLSEFSASILSSSSSAASGEHAPVSAPSWRSTALLRSHVDGVRALCFHSSDPWLVSASEDGTAKIWQLGDIVKKSRGGGLSGSGAGVEETKGVEAFFTYRGHRGPVLAAALCEELGWLATGGFDSQVALWRLPPSKQELYGAFGRVAHLRVAALDGHADAVWALAAHPTRALLYSAAADGTVAAWRLEEGNSHRLASWRLPASSSSSSFSSSSPSSSLSSPSSPASAEGSIPSALCLPSFGTHQLLVATTAGAVIQLDATTGQCVRVISAIEESSSASSTNPSSSSSSSLRALAVTVHPAMAVAFSAHVDGTVRVLDLASGRCVHRLAAHADAVTALAVVESTTMSAGSGASGGGSSGSSASVGGQGRYLVTAGHDAAVRTWDLGTQRCVHDLAEHQTHRRKYDEGVHALALHRTSGLLATAGADSIVRVFAGGVGA